MNKKDCVHPCGIIVTKIITFGSMDSYSTAGEMIILHSANPIRFELHFILVGFVEDFLSTNLDIFLDIV